MNAIEQALLDCLNEETAAVNEFKAALETETHALTERSAFDELEAVTTTKNRLVTRLTELDAQRDTLFEQLSSGKGWEETAQTINNSPELAQAWARLQEMSRAAQELNKRNGVLLDVHLRHTQQSLDALHAVMGQSHTYDEHGQVRPAAGGKRIGAG